MTITGIGRELFSREFDPACENRVILFPSTKSSRANNFVVFESDLVNLLSRDNTRTKRAFSYVLEVTSFSFHTRREDS